MGIMGQRGFTAMMGRKVFFTIFLFLYLTLPPALCCVRVSAPAFHKYHLSFTQIEYNAKDKTAEITIRVFADDLENALSKRKGQPVKLEHKEIVPLIISYVRENFVLQDRHGRVQKLFWVGLEPKADVAFLYLEAKTPAGIAGLQLRHHIFFELFEDQLNQVLLKSERQKASLEFKRGESFKMISF